MSDTEIPIKDDVVGTWRFLVPSNSISCDDELDELTDICSKLFSCFGDFVLPCGIKFQLQRFPGGAVVPTSEEGGPEQRIDVEHVSLSDEDGVEEDSLIGALNDEKSGTYVPSVEFNRIKVRMRLDSDDVFVDRFSHTYEYQPGGKTGGTPYYDPLRLKIQHWTNYIGEIDSQFLFLVEIDVKTDHWFEQTQVAQTNRHRLATFLRQVDETLPVGMLERDTDYDNTDHMKEVF